MTDPERLLASSLSGDDVELERALLRSVSNVAPPAFAKEAAWRGIAARVSLGAVAGAGIASVAPKAAAMTPALVGKVVAVVVVAGSALVATSVWLPRAEHADRGAPTAPALVTPPPVVAKEVVPVPVVPEVPAAAEVVPPAETSKAPARREKNDALALESELLTEARAELRSGDARGAMSTLRKLEGLVPHPVLGQEREVLTIQALAATGMGSAAKRRARAFLAAHPKSPHASSLRSIAGAD